MAVGAGTIWEWRPATGVATNGGGYNSARGGSDYSQSDTGVSVGTVTIPAAAPTTLTASSNSGFLANMVGNCVYLALAGGAGGTAGWYEIVSVESSTACTLDRSTGVSGSNVTGATSDGAAVRVGGALAPVAGATVSTWLATLAAGNTVYVKAGTATITTANITAGTAGTTAAPVKFIGYNATRTDAPTGDNRPLIDLVANSWALAALWQLSNLRITTSSASGVTTTSGTYITLTNCKVTNTSTSDRPAFVPNTGNRLVNCEFAATGGSALSLASAYVTAIDCWIHDSLVGVKCAAQAANKIANCLIENCATGISLTTGVAEVFVGNTIGGCGTAILATGAATGNLLLNNLIAYNTVGANWSGGTNYPDNYADYNNWYANGTDATNLTKGGHDTAYDPALQGFRSWTDLVVSHADNKVITSVTGGFMTYLAAGDYIWIGAATDWTSGAYRIVTVDSATQLTLASSPAAIDKTGGIARTLRTAVRVSDGRPGSASGVLTHGIGLSLGVGAAATPAQGAWQPSSVGGPRQTYRFGTAGITG